MLDRFIFKIADPTERKSALDLQRAVYLSDTGHAPADSLDHAVADYLVALDQHRDVVAAFRVVRPEHRPFDLEAFINLSRLIPRDRSVAMIGRLCVHPDSRSVTRAGLLPIGLLKLAYEFALKHSISDYVMYTFPRLRRFYQSALFESLGVSFTHPGYRCKMDVMRLNISSIRNGDPASGTWENVLKGPQWPNVLL